MATRKPTASEDSDRVLSRRILVHIKHSKDMTSSLAKVIWAHELAVLEAVWGEGMVTVVDPSTMDDGYSAKQSPDLMPYNKTQDRVLPPSETASLGFVFVGDARSEYERLASVYGRHIEKNVSYVEDVYGRFQDGKFERVLGLADFTDMPDAQLRQLAREHGHLPEVSRDATPEERRAAAAAASELAKMPRAQLLQLVTDLAGALV